MIQTFNPSINLDLNQRQTYSSRIDDSIPQSSQTFQNQKFDSNISQSFASTSRQTQQTYCPKVVDHSEGNIFNRSSDFSPNLTSKEY